MHLPESQLYSLICFPVVYVYPESYLFFFVVVGLLPMGALEVMTVLEAVTGRE
jgi:hypothetical protein